MVAYGSFGSDSYVELVRLRSVRQGRADRHRYADERDDAEHHIHYFDNHDAHNHDHNHDHNHHDRNEL